MGPRPSGGPYSAGVRAFGCEDGKEAGHAQYHRATRRKRAGSETDNVSRLELWLGAPTSAVFAHSPTDAPASPPGRAFGLNRLAVTSSVLPVNRWAAPDSITTEAASS